MTDARRRMVSWDPDQSSQIRGTRVHWPNPTPNFIALLQTVYEKTLHFYTLHNFGAPCGPLEPKFANLGDDI